MQFPRSIFQPAGAATEWHCALRRLRTSLALLEEPSATLSRPQLARAIARSGLTLHELRARYLNLAGVVEPPAVPRVVSDDPNDDEVLACTLAAHAEVIVSADEASATSSNARPVFQFHMDIPWTAAHR